jgi:hypothetical protein
MAPGKSVPLAMGEPWTDEERRKAWDAWVAKQFAAARRFLGETGEPGADKEEG